MESSLSFMSFSFWFTIQKKSVILKLMGIGGIFSNSIEKAKELVSKAAEFIRSHLLIAGCAAGAVLIIIVLLFVLALSRTVKREAPRDLQAELENAFEPMVIPPEDFFLPYEPDFVPDVLLEREPRDGWGEEDARPFWTDPLEGNEELWRLRIEKGIDTILEKVP
jgi:hypothetical protein